MDVKTKKVVTILYFLLLAVIIIGCSRPVQREPVTPAPEPAQQEQIPSATAPIGYYEGPIIDNHAHPIPPWVGEQNIYYDGLVRRMDETGVVKAALHRNAEWTRGYTSFSPEHDEWVLAAHERHPDRIIPYLGGFDPREPDAVSYIREQLQTGKWKGIGELDLRNRNSKTKIPANSPVMMQIYKLAAEYGVPVIIHYEVDYGVSVSEGEQELEDALEKNPDTIIIFAHSPPIHLMKEHPNLWAEISLFDPNASELLRNIHESERDLLDRIVLCVADVQAPDFLQRFPFTDRTFTYEELVDLARQELGELPQEFAQKVAYENLVGLLGITVPAITVSPAPAPKTTTEETPSPAPAPTPTPLPQEQPGLAELMGLQPGYDISVVYLPLLRWEADIEFGPSGELLVVGHETPWIARVTLDGEVSVFADLPSGATALAYNFRDELFVAIEGGTFPVPPAIYKVSPEGELTFFSKAHAFDMAFGPDGYLYAIAPQSSVITKISPEGKTTSFATDLQWPVDVEFSPSGELFVSDTGLGKVLKVNSDGTTETIVDHLARGGDPISLAFDKQGNLFVASLRTDIGEGGIYQVSLEDGSLTSIQTGPPLTPAYSDMLIDDAGDIFVADQSTGILCQVTPQGEVKILVESWYRTEGMAVGPSGDLFIADNIHRPVIPGRVLRLDSEGTISTFAQGFQSPVALTFDDSGNLFVVDDWAGEVVKVTPDGRKETFASNLGNPHSITYDPVSRAFFVFSRMTQEILRITQDGEVSVLPIDFGAEVDMCDLAVDNEGNLLADVVWAENWAVGPTLSSLFRITPASGEMTLLHERQIDQPLDSHSIALDPSSGDVFVLWRTSVAARGQWELNKVTTEGDIYPVATTVDADAMGMAISPEGDIFFGCITGIYRIFRTE